MTWWLKAQVVSVAELLELHPYRERDSISGPARCWCGWEQVVPLGRSARAAWAVHVALEMEDKLK